MPHSLLVDSIQKLLRRNAERNLRRILERTHDADIALVLRSLSLRDVERTFRLLPDLQRQAEVLAESDPEIREHVASTFDDDELIDLLREMSGDDAADLLELVPEERADQLLSVWKGDEAREVDTLLGYDPETAGGIMSPDVFALPENTTAQEAIETLQANHEDLEMAFYLYVVNEHGHLVGVCSLRQLVVSLPNERLTDFMTPDVISVDVSTDQEEVARLVARYNFLAIPVVDGTNRLVGLVTVDDIIDVIREEATEDMLNMAGAGGVDLADQGNPLKSARQRMPWLLASFFGGIGSMFIIGAFEDALLEVAALAAFIPVTIGMGGNVGTQAATIVTRGIALGRIDFSRFTWVVTREVMTGVVLGIVYGVLLAIVAAVVWGGGDTWTAGQLAGTVSLSVAACMALAATVGGSVPLIFERMGVDPAVATGPLVTTSVDIVGVWVYFVIGGALLGV